MTGVQAARDILARGMKPPCIAAISRASVTAVREWLAGAAPPDAAALRLIVAARALRVFELPRAYSHELSSTVSSFAELVERHCRSRSFPR